MNAASERPTVLVVDDTPANLSLLSNLLKEQYRIKVANSGKKALELAAAAPPDLVLLDIMMPEMDGFEVCRRLKAGEATRRVPVIFLTAKTEPEDEELGFAVGAVDFIHKPISPPILAARVKTQLEIKAWHDLIDQQNAGLRQNNRLIRQTFGRYLSEDVVADILALPDGAALGGESRLVTIMMTDLRGFTSVSERLPAGDVLKVVNIYLEEMTEVIVKYRGTIIEFIGDAILAVFGAPNQREDDAGRGVACAIEMQNAMQAVNARCRQLGYPEVEQGIGINTGEAVVGHIGSARRTKYGLVGRHVNLTGRIESYSVGGQILVSEHTAKACGPVLRIGDTLEVMPKGVRKPITLYDVHGIEGEYRVALELREASAPVELREAVPVGFVLLEEKHATKTTYGGSLRALSLKEALIHAEIPVERLANLKLNLAAEEGGEANFDLYAKVVESPAAQASTFRVNFTSVPPEARSYLEAVLAKNGGPP